MFNNQIKQETREAHQELEKQVITRLKHIRSNDDYGDILYKFYIYFQALEQQLSYYITPDILPDFKERRKSERLKEDLDAIGYKAPAATGPVAIPQLDTPCKALGALYVMEGSVMGGPVIIRILEEKCGIRTGISFFSGYGADTPSMWQSFRHYMNIQATTADTRQEIIAAANETFKNFSILFPQHEQAS